MKNRQLNTLANWVTIITGAITFINFGYSVKVNLNIASIAWPNLFRIDLPFRLISFIVLEAILAYAFGRLLILIEKQGAGIPFVMLFVIGLFSAWTSLFNVQWLLIGPIPSQAPYDVYFAKLFFSAILATGIAIYLITVHGKKSYKGYATDFIFFSDSNITRCNIVQLVCFIAMLIIFFNA